MLREQIKKEIIEIVTSKAGCKQSGIISSLRREVISSSEDILDLIDELVTEKKLVPVNYVLTSMPYRTKTFLLPPCDSVKVV